MDSHPHEHLGHGAANALRIALAAGAVDRRIELCVVGSAPTGVGALPANREETTIYNASAERQARFVSATVSMARRHDSLRSARTKRENAYRAELELRTSAAEASEASAMLMSTGTCVDVDPAAISQTTARRISISKDGTTPFNHDNMKSTPDFASSGSRQQLAEPPQPAAANAMHPPLTANDSLRSDSIRRSRITLLRFPTCADIHTGRSGHKSIEQRRSPVALRPASASSHSAGPRCRPRTYPVHHVSASPFSHTKAQALPPRPASAQLACSQPMATFSHESTHTLGANVLSETPSKQCSTRDLLLHLANSRRQSLNLNGNPSGKTLARKAPSTSAKVRLACQPFAGTACADSQTRAHARTSNGTRASASADKRGNHPMHMINSLSTGICSAPRPSSAPAHVQGRLGLKGPLSIIRGSPVVRPRKSNGLLFSPQLGCVSSHSSDANDNSILQVSKNGAYSATGAQLPVPLSAPSSCSIARSLTGELPREQDTVRWTSRTKASSVPKCCSVDLRQSITHARALDGRVGTEGATSSCLASSPKSLRLANVQQPRVCEPWRPAITD